MNNGLWANSSMMQAALAGRAADAEVPSREEWPQAIQGAIYQTRDERYVLDQRNQPEQRRWRVMEARRRRITSRPMSVLRPSNLRSKNARGPVGRTAECIIGAMDLAEVETRFKQRGVNHGVIQTPAECANDEHMIANGCFPEVEGCDGIRTIDNPIQIDGVAKVKPQKPPEIGGDSLAELAAIGYSEDEISALIEAGAVAAPR